MNKLRKQPSRKTKKIMDNTKLSNPFSNRINQIPQNLIQTISHHTQISLRNLHIYIPQPSFDAHQNIIKMQKSYQQQQLRIYQLNIPIEYKNQGKQMEEKWSSTGKLDFALQIDLCNWKQNDSEYFPI